MRRRALVLLLALGTGGAFMAGARADEAGAEALLRAVLQNDSTAVQDLLARGVDPNARNDHGAPMLYVALQEGTLQAANALLASPRISVNALNANDESPLMMAALKGQLGMAKRLIGLGAQVNKSGWAPLHYAATGGHVDIMRLLLDHGAAVNAPSPNGTTPLMMAARYGTTQSVTLLIRAGADANARNQLGLTAIDFAQRGERPDVVKLIAAALRSSQSTPLGQW